MLDTPIIVGGFYRSGTTLVRRLLDGHSRIHCGPEVKFFKDFYGDYLNDPLAHVRLFSTARTYRLRENNLLAIFGRAFLEFHEVAARAAGKARWADKNPENVLYLEQWQLLLPRGFTFVHVVRDPFDTLASLVEVGFPKAVPAEFEEKARLLKKYRDEAAAYCASHPATSVEIRYEDLVAAPEATMRGLLQRLGEDFEPALLQSIAAPERGSGIEDPKAGRHAVVHADSVGRGCRDLSADQREMVSRHLSAYL